MATVTDDTPDSPASRFRMAPLMLAGILIAGAALWAAILIPGSPSAGDDGGGPPLFSDTESMLKEPATVSGRVTQRYGRSAFVVAVGGGRDVVILPAETGGERPRGQVRATGSVRRVGVDLQPIIGGDVTVRRGDPALEEATVTDLPG